MKKTVEELKTALQTLIGERTDDEAIGFIEDFNDSIEELSNKDNEDWKTKYEQNDAEWRKKYRDRFFNGKVDEDIEKPKPNEHEEPDEEKTTIDDLFIKEDKK